jgi:hypothetical protein
MVSTFGLAKDYLLSLNRDSDFRLLCTHKDVEQILAAALLHDLGQYAFSHTLEDLRKLGDRFDIAPLREIKHDQELVKDYIDIRDDDGASIRSILDDMSLDTEEILYMLGKGQRQSEYGSAANIGRDIVSGVIDADRVSYLVQDSRTAGTSFGDAINVDQLIESLCVRTDGGDATLGIRESGVSAVEAVLAAVYWMYRNVYWHPINRGMMAGIKHVFWDLLQHGGMPFSDYTAAVFGASERKALSQISERYERLIAANPGWYNPIESIARGGRSAMIRVWSTGGSAPSRTGISPPHDVYWGVYRNLRRDLFKDVVRAVVEALPSKAAPRRGEVLMDIPMKKRILESVPSSLTRPEDTETEAGRREPLWVKLMGGGTAPRWVLLEEHTPLVKALADAEDLKARKVRVFFAKSLLERCPGDRAALWLLVDGAVRNVVGVL